MNRLGRRAVSKIASGRRGALVLGGDYRGLGIAQSLGRQGIPVWVLREPSGHRIATMSRYVQRSLIWPGSHDDDNVAFLLDLNHTHGLQDWLLFPTGDEMTAFVGMHHAQLSSRYCLTTPPWEVFRWAYDKRLTYRLASEIGVPTPLTVYPFTSETPYSGPYPAIVKPGVKLGLDRLSIEKAWRVEDSAELAERFEEAATLHDPATLIARFMLEDSQAEAFRPSRGHIMATLLSAKPPPSWRSPDLGGETRCSKRSTPSAMPNG